MKRISKTYKFRLYLKPSQEKIFRNWAGGCRYLYNAALEQRILYWNQYKKSLTEYDQSGELKALKKTEGFEWFKDIPAQCLQQTLKDLNRAYQGFFRGGGFPKFKSRTQGDSFRFPQPSQFSLRKLTGRLSALKLPKIGEVKFRKTQEIEGQIKNATIIRNGSRWYVCLSCEVELVPRPIVESDIGVDRGVVHTLTICDGEKSRFYDLPGRIIELEKRRSRLQSRLRNKKKFSKNWRKSQDQIGKLSSKISRIRLDFHHKVTTDLTKSHGQICLEDLKVKNMTKSAKGNFEQPGKNVSQKRGLNRSILRQGWHQFERLLEYKASWYGSKVVYIHPKDTSRVCSECGHNSPLNRKSQESFECGSCGQQENADVNAAKNILAMGLRKEPQRKKIITRGRRGRACGDVEAARICEAGTSVAL